MAAIFKKSLMFHKNEKDANNQSKEGTMNNTPIFLFKMASTDPQYFDQYTNSKDFVFA